MGKKVFLLWLILFCALQGIAQTDSATTITPPDTTALANPRAVAVSEPAKGKIWAITATIAAIIASSYFIYNVRSK